MHPLRDVGLAPALLDVHLDCLTRCVTAGGLGREIQFRRRGIPGFVGLSALLEAS
jgi:hypothetical protein